MDNKPRQLIARWSLVFGLAVAIGGVALPALAQNFIEPTSPLGGSTAWPLNSSANTQYKRGSLIIGSSTSPSSLCLNTDSVGNTPNCITSWSQISGAYVTLGQPATITGTTIADYKVGPGRTADIGFARIQADPASNQLYSVIAEANSAPTSGYPAVGVVATDGGNSANYAAEFLGRVFIGSSDSASTTDYQLCLNGTMDAVTVAANANYGRGCIRRWSDLAAFAPPGNYVTLQPMSNIPVPENGQIAITGTATLAASQGSVVIGAPSATTPIALTCGDGICNGAETMISCPQDCDRTPPANVSALAADTSIRSQSSYAAALTWTDPTVSDYVGVRIYVGTTPSTGPTTAGVSYVTVAKSSTQPNHKIIYNLQYGTTTYITLYSYDTRFNYSAGQTIALHVNSNSTTCVNHVCEVPVTN